MTDVRHQTQKAEQNHEAIGSFSLQAQTFQTNFFLPPYFPKTRPYGRQIIRPINFFLQPILSYLAEFEDDWQQWGD
jgi:hypothetical protein